MTQSRFRRYLEIFPGLATWIALAVPIVASFYYPFAVAIFIIIFDLFWLYKAIIMSFHLISGYRRLRRSERTSWQMRVESIKPTSLILDPEVIYHAVMLVTYKESIDILRSSIDSVVEATFPNERLIFVLATEERDKENARKYSEILQREYKGKFFAFLATEHPDDIPGETKAKGANATWAARQLLEFVKKKDINPENVVVSTADADSRFHHQYFSALSYEYATNPNRLQRSYQPIPIFANNIWQASALARILAFGSTFWQLIESTRPWRLINFSTHSMSLATLEDIDFWDVTVVNEDSRQFWRAYFAFEGDHQVVPIFLPIYMDAVMDENLTSTLKSQYLQRMRWAYGIEHFPYVVMESIKHKKIPLGDRLIKIYRLFEANFTWATASLFIPIVVWLPILLNKDFSQTVLAFNIPLFASRLLAVTWIGLIISAFLAYRMMPPLPKKYSRLKFIELVLQWILIPVSAVAFGSIPAIAAQTRLMFGKYLGFHTIKKVRRTQ